MGDYLVTFTPAEPYFFGNEKTFSFDKSKNGSYYIVSEDVPSQSTILGSLRYMFLPVKKTDYQYTAIEIDDNNLAVGSSSFDIDSPTVQSFGKIKKISPVFIVKGNRQLIPVPCIHKSGKRGFTPLSEYEKTDTDDGKKYYFSDYDAKSGLSGDYLCLPKLSVVKKQGIIKSAERTGNNRSAENDGFFKREFKKLKEGYSFAVYADIDDELDGKTEIVTLGQCKSPFSVHFVKQENTLENTIKEKLDKKISGYTMVYCFGDTVVKSNPCENTLFAAFSTKDYRAFKTQSCGKVEKGPVLHRLVKAGGIFITDEPGDWIKKHENKNAQQIGFNNFIIIGGKNNESSSF